MGNSMDIDGGNAFPRQDDVYNNGADGMTLRDYFAGQAMNSIMQNVGTRSYEQAAAWAYSTADAMIKAREGK